VSKMREALCMVKTERIMEEAIMVLFKFCSVLVTLFYVSFSTAQVIWH
jgi:hypothetical protein